MNKEELEAANKLIDTPITADNVNDPIEAVFPEKPSGAESADIGKLDSADESGKVNRVEEL